MNIHAETDYSGACPVCWTIETPLTWVADLRTLLCEPCAQEYSEGTLELQVIA